MKKLVNGLIEFQKNLRPQYTERFAELALGQKPDVLFFACSDSRVVPNLFASTEPGDLFVLRNVGNIIPPANDQGISTADESELAALEFAVMKLQVKDVVVCGHSCCGAMQALANKAMDIPPHLKSWLRHAEGATNLSEQYLTDHPPLDKADQLSLKNVLWQLEHIKSYPFVIEAIQEGRLRVHAWWFDIRSASVYGLDYEDDRFHKIDSMYGQTLLNRFFHEH